MSDEYDYNSILGNPSSSNESNDDLDNLFGESNVFDSVNREELPDNPFELPANTYRWRITSVKMARTGKGTGDKVGLTLKYVVAEGPYTNRQAGEWLRIPFPSEDIEESQRIQALSNLNLHLKAFGLSVEQINGFNHRNCNQLLGTEFWGTTVNAADRQDPSRKNIKFTKWIPLSGNNSGDEYNPFGLNV